LHDDPQRPHVAARIIEGRVIRTRSLSLVLLGVLAASRAGAQAGGWETHGPAYPDVHAIALSPDDDRVVYAGAFDPASGRSALFRSTDGGDSWTDLADAPFGEVIDAIAVDPANSSRLLALTHGTRATVYRSDDAGATWSIALGPNGAGPTSIFFDTADTGRAYAFGEPGLWRGDGGTWMRLRPSITPTDGSRASVGQLVSAWPGAAGRVFATAWVSQGYRGFGSGTFLLMADEAGRWTEFGFAPCQGAGVQATAYDPQNPNIMYVAGRQCGGLLETRDGGRSWSVPSLPAIEAVQILVAVQDPATLYVLSPPGTPGSQPAILRSFDGGVLWSGLAPPPETPTQLALGPTGRVIYAATAQGVFARPLRSTWEVSPRE
jgi:photosystem II stability/assembly factor-like uncharacterized protein